MERLSLRIGLNTLIQAVGKAISLIFSFILLGFLTRYLGPVGYGDYITIFAYWGFFAIFGEFGLDQILVKELAIVKENPQEVTTLVDKVLSLRLVLISISMILAVLISLAFPYSSTVRLGILIVSLSSFFYYATSALMSYFQVKLNFFYPVFADTFGKIAVVIVSLFFILVFKCSLPLLVGVSVLGGLISFLTIFFFFQREQLNFSFTFDFSGWKQIFSLAFPLFLVSFLNQVFFRIDTPLLSIISGSEAVGIYGLAFKVYEFAALPASFFTASIFPVLASQIKEKKRFKKTFLKSIVLLLGSGLIMTLIIFGLSSFWVGVLGGEDFTSSILPLKILSLSLVFLYLTGFFMTTLVVLEKQKQLFYLFAMVSILNIFLNLIFIPRFSFLATSWNSVLTQIVVSVGMLLVIINKLK